MGRPARSQRHLPSALRQHGIADAPQRAQGAAHPLLALPFGAAGIGLIGVVFRSIGAVAAEAILHVVGRELGGAGFIRRNVATHWPRFGRLDIAGAIVGRLCGAVMHLDSTIVRLATP